VDISTKPLPKETFEKLLDLVQGGDCENTYYPHCQTRECEFK